MDPHPDIEATCPGRNFGPGAFRDLFVVHRWEWRQSIQVVVPKSRPSRISRVDSFSASARFDLGDQRRRADYRMATHVRNILNFHCKGRLNSLGLAS